MFHLRAIPLSNIFKCLKLGVAPPIFGQISEETTRFDWHEVTLTHIHRVVISEQYLKRVPILKHFKQGGGAGVITPKYFVHRLRLDQGLFTIS